MIFNMEFNDLCHLIKNSGLDEKSIEIISNLDKKLDKINKQRQDDRQKLYDLICDICKDLKDHLDRMEDRIKDLQDSFSDRINEYIDDSVREISDLQGQLELLRKRAEDIDDLVEENYDDFDSRFDVTETNIKELDDKLNALISIIEEKAKAVEKASMVTD